MPKSPAELKGAVKQCLKLSPVGDCTKHPHGPIGEWDVSHVTNMQYLFAYAKSFNGDISKWDVSSVANMGYMFSHATSFNGDISKWDVSRVVSMSTMFFDARAFNCDISKWDVSKVTAMIDMFNGASSFSRTLCGVWKTVRQNTNENVHMFLGSHGKICS